MYERVIALQPGHAEAHYKRGNALRPDYAECHFNRGTLFSTRKQWDAALAGCDQAIALRPDYAQAHCEWRWLLERTDSPWYRTVKLFRQQAIGDWDGVFVQVAADLRKTFATAG